ncbi:hypothetical protein [Lactobacillus iners]|uniref:hypothetical protein n=1 Tax=Lactobacillus iners TaxID=147802 RepID=UPI001E418E62|nr:hypothetical protein [Lactobacillus iners]
MILQKKKNPYTCQLKEQMFYIREYTNMGDQLYKLKDRQADMDMQKLKSISCLRVY